jgi:hypothetical protein
MKSVGQILSRIRDCDVLIYQPLRSDHGKLSEEHIRGSIVAQGATAISFPYVFNSGMYSLAHAPRASGREYGRIYGQECVTGLLESHPLHTVLELYREGQIDFGLATRFSSCMDELRQREQTTDIKLSAYIGRNYRQRKLFLSHNHPATALFLHILSQIRDLVRLPLSLDRIDTQNDNLAALPVPYGSPISPYDRRVHGLQFDHRPDWYERGRYLIALMALYHSGGQPWGSRLVARYWLLVHRMRRSLRLAPQR